MKIKRNEFESVIDQIDHQLHGSTKTYVDALLRELGIEIVPDPGPEAPERPLVVAENVMAPEGTKYDFGIVDATGRGIAMRNVLPNSEWVGRPGLTRNEIRRHLEALVSAYNAAGERKKIRVTHEEADPQLQSFVFAVNDERGRFLCRAEAVGYYVMRHASDLGLEIVES